MFTLQEELNAKIGIDKLNRKQIVWNDGTGTVHVNRFQKGTESQANMTILKRINYIIRTEIKVVKIKL